jgi:O-antigen ligase
MTAHAAFAHVPAHLSAGRAARSPLDRWGWLYVALVVAVWAATPVIGFAPALGLLVLAGVLSAVAGLFQPAFGLIGVALLCTVDSLTRVILSDAGFWRWNLINYWLVFVAALFPGVLRLRLPGFRILYLMVLLLGVELLLSPDFGRGVQDILRLVSSFGLLVYCWRARGTPEAWYWAAAISGVTAALGGFVFLRQRSMLPYLNPNAWAYLPITALFVICIAFAVASDRSRGRAVLGALAGVCMVWVFLSSSRGALLIAACCGLMMMLSLRGVGARVTLVGVAAMLGLAASALFGDLQERTLHRLALFVDVDRSLAVRTSRRSVLAEGGWMIFQRYPLGVGTGGFAVTFHELGADREQRDVARRHERKDAHSAWIKVLAENGAPGLLLLTGFVGSFALVGLRSRSRRRRLLGFFTSGALAAAFLTTEFQAKAPWLLAAASATLLARPRRGPAALHPPAESGEGDIVEEPADAVAAAGAAAPAAATEGDGGADGA